eukprot:9186089-Pyramimonas_sp.AAC.1
MVASPRPPSSAALLAPRSCLGLPPVLVVHVASVDEAWELWVSMSRMLTAPLVYQYCPSL